MDMHFLDGLAIVVALFIIFTKRRVHTRSGWVKYFDNVQFDIEHFYNELVIEIDLRKIPGIHTSKESYLDTHIMSERREYLVVDRGHHKFYICAAPFGTGMYVSWRIAEKEEGILAKIPVIRTLAGNNPENKTYYQLDTEAMYKAVVHNAVLSVIDSHADTKGMRLTEIERQPTEYRK